MPPPDMAAIRNLGAPSPRFNAGEHLLDAVATELHFPAFSTKAFCASVNGTPARKLQSAQATSQFRGGA
ncbi:hypothetical protein [Acetobacter ghanensis]|uniref:Uncharacterized protein n=1 Tax=Acetobacter ghanensis TaxID=431306 RepID=A0A0U5F3T8_9PROT|nr:hypothetical protein [Acetobacter ghanensis]NHO39460.1 hypothetical protein [Acetobacter ghanensis]CEF54605.1 hypothetical protein predicted by Glimmer/Critica [Acetobacter ghanensis]